MTNILSVQVKIFMVVGVGVISNECNETFDLKDEQNSGLATMPSRA